MMRRTIRPPGMISRSIDDACNCDTSDAAFTPADALAKVGGIVGALRIEDSRIWGPDVLFISALTDAGLSIVFTGPPASPVTAASGFYAFDPNVASVVGVNAEGILYFNWMEIIFVADMDALTSDELALLIGGTTLTHAVQSTGRSAFWRLARAGHNAIDISAEATTVAATTLSSPSSYDYVRLVMPAPRPVDLKNDTFTLSIPAVVGLDACKVAVHIGSWWAGKADNGPLWTDTTSAKGAHRAAIQAATRHGLQALFGPVANAARGR